MRRSRKRAGGNSGGGDKAAFDFLHRPHRKRKPNSWYENAIVIAVAGSIIVVVGQLAGTIIPIMYGAQDGSDYSISVDPVSIKDKVYFGYPEDFEDTKKTLGIQNETIIFPADSSAEYINLGEAEIKVEDLHPFIRPYKFGVFLTSSGAPSNSTITFDPPEIKPGGVSHMTIKLTWWGCLDEGDYPIIIKGLGGDGKTRTTTVFFSYRIVGNVVPICPFWTYP
jgi:hypothetical protein